RMLQSNPQLVQTLLDRTINEGHSIGTLGLYIRELKRTSMDALTAFEDAIGVKGYERLLQAQGNILVLARLTQYSSAEMQIDFSRMLQSNPQLVQTLLDRTTNEGHSIGTLGLSIRELKRTSMNALAAFENAIGVKGYEKLLQFQGTIPILARLIQSSSMEMQNELALMLQSNPQLVQTLLEKTIKKGSSIGALDISLRILGRENAPCLQILENLIGVDGYFEMFSKCNANTITIMRIMACSSLSDSLVDKICDNTDIWQESRNYISEDSCTILKDFNNDLFYAKKMNRENFFDFIRVSISAEEWMDWMRRGATLEEAVLIMRNLSFSTARQISNIWLQNYAEVIDDFLLVRQQRTEKQNINPQVINRAIWSIRNYNPQLSALLDKDYRQLCPEHDSKS
ncbi:MAG: hypothetical protein K2N80_02160, partial [Lachnospiraceae bacterium]|nr:hypothetical protein [Lachnospiraceae bacterium]